MCECSEAVQKQKERLDNKFIKKNFFFRRKEDFERHRL